jgi:hypothetical protein
MVEASCHCGAVRLQIDSPPPAEVNDCRCSICRRYGTLWAYYSPERVRVLPSEPPTDVYVWGDRTLETHRCRGCGCVSHWVAMDPGVDVMGVNARLMDPEVLAAARVRYSAGS